MYVVQPEKLLEAVKEEGLTHGAEGILIVKGAEMQEAWLGGHLDLALCYNEGIKFPNIVSRGDGGELPSGVSVGDINLPTRPGSFDLEIGFQINGTDTIHLVPVKEVFFS